MSNPHIVMPVNVIDRASTLYGVELGESFDISAPRFLVHECGYLSEGMEGWEAERISSPFWRLWYMRGRGHWIAHEDNRWNFHANCIAFAPAHVVFSFGSARPAAQLWVHFSLIPDYAFTVEKPFTITLDSLLREQIHSLIQLQQNPQHVNRKQIYHYSLALLHNCFARHPLEMHALPESLSRILRYIDENLGASLTNDLLARHAGMSTGHFIRWFKGLMEQTPGDYIHQTRLQQASKLLLFSDLSIGQIAAEMGFSNRDHFSRAFSNRFGCGPATFRKEHLAV